MTSARGGRRREPERSQRRLRRRAEGALVMAIPQTDSGRAAQSRQQCPGGRRTVGVSHVLVELRVRRRCSQSILRKEVRVIQSHSVVIAATGGLYIDHLYVIAHGPGGSSSHGTVYTRSLMNAVSSFADGLGSNEYPRSFRLSGSCSARGLSCVGFTSIDKNSCSHAQDTESVSALAGTGLVPRWRLLDARKEHKAGVFCACLLAKPVVVPSQHRC